MQMEMLQKNVNLLAYPMFVLLFFSVLKGELFYELQQTDYFTVIIISPLVQIMINAFNLDYVFRIICFDKLKVTNRRERKIYDNNKQISELRLTINQMKYCNEELQEDLFKECFNRIYTNLYGFVLLLLLLINLEMNFNSSLSRIITAIIISGLIVVLIILFFIQRRRTIDTLILFKTISTKTLQDKVTNTDTFVQFNNEIRKCNYKKVKKLFKKLLFT